MKMEKQKTAWLITHDPNVDRRIFFFADALTEKGYHVTLFPAHYVDFSMDPDPSYVRRPVDKSVVKLYDVSTDQLQTQEQQALKTVIEAQERYKAQNGKYARHEKDLKLRWEIKGFALKPEASATNISLRRLQMESAPYSTTHTHSIQRSCRTLGRRRTENRWKWR